ncbi:MAG: hypothetical protein HY319_03480 [Armatimonadetes bacterium]|nr:hypothetical protein [Armatimonadota bacterium]
MNHQPSYNPNTAQWTFFSWASFITAGWMMYLGILHLPTDLWVKGYLAMGILFMVGSSFTLSKTIRDNHEWAERSRWMRDTKGEERAIPLVLHAKD